jgi:broad specificity phosphatase PhoE
MTYEQMLAKYGEGNFDASDPDLTDESKQKAEELTEQLFQKFGPPVAIFHSQKRRCKQTAEPAIKRFARSEVNVQRALTFRLRLQGKLNRSGRFSFYRKYF